MNTKEFKNFEKGFQYCLHSRDMYMIERYGFDELPLRVINHAYRLAVDETLYKYNIEVLSDVAYGQAYEAMRVRFIELLKDIKENMEKK
jgi:hypothetical protein